MNILFPVLAAMAVFAVALRLYPRFIARVFGENDANAPPSRRFADGRDFVESRSLVVFAQHFAAIAGAGPIVGPTLALAFGWQPVWLWIVLGGIFFAAVHDMSVLFTSVRESGTTIVGIERMSMLLPDSSVGKGLEDVAVYDAVFGSHGPVAGLTALEELRLAGIHAVSDFRSANLKAHLRQADRLACRFTLIIGDDEVVKGSAILRDRETQVQYDVNLATLSPQIQSPSSDVLKLAFSG